MYKFYNRYFVQPPGCMAKVLLTMKITILLLITAILQVSASSYAQKITLSEKNASINAVFNKISLQSGYDFLVNQTILNNAQPVTINVKNVELKEVLEQIFKNQALEYEMTDKFVKVKVKEESFLNKILNVILAKNINGKVVDQNGNPLAGATVSVVGSANYTHTSESGFFILQNVNENATVRISYIGYVSRDLKASDDFSAVKLSVNDSKLDEVKIIAYGTTTQRLSTGSVGTISAEDIEKQPVNNILDALVGRIAGLQVTPTSGIAGAAPKVTIRGQSSITTGTDPLYILDGVPITASQSLSYAGGLDNFSLNLLMTLNTTDIESVSVLKDADATAIYGSRGANGVILITTKKGKATKLTTNLKLSTGFEQVPSFIHMLNADQYTAMRKEAFANDNITPTLTNAPDLLSWDKSQVHDWQKEFIGKTGTNDDLELSVSGGSENTKYFISTGYHKEGTVMPGDSKMERKSFLLTLSNTSDDKKFNLESHISYSGTTLNSLPTDLVSKIGLAPYYPLYNADGTPNWSVTTFPLSYTLQKYAAPTTNFAANALMSYEFIPGLKLKLMGGLTKTTVNMSQEQPLLSLSPTSTAASSTLINQNTENDNWIIEPQIAYDRNFGKNHLSALAGATFQSTKYTSLSLTGTNFPNDNLISNIAGAGTITTSNIFTPYTYNAVFGRVSYDFNQEYLANVTFRRDGSSRFGDGHKFGNFGAVGLGWIFTQEKAVTDAIPFLSYGKIRGSYGVTGNDQIGDFLYLNVYGSTSSGYDGLPSLQPAGIANPDLRWETINKLETSLDLGFFKDRILLTGAFYQNRSGNQLVLNNVSTQTGFFYYQYNFPGVVQTRGFEIELTTKNIKGPFNWTTNLNFSRSNNKLISYPDFASSNYTFRLAIGQSLNVIKGYQLAGLNASGVPVYTLANGTVSASPNQNFDRVILGDKDPMYGGITNNLSYKGFNFSFFFRYDRFRGTPAYYPRGTVGSLNSNFSTFVLDRWQKPGDEANTIIPRFTTNGGLYSATNYLGSDQLTVNRSIVRLSNASLGYNLPAPIVSKLKMHQIQLYVNGQNLYVFDKHKDYELDPQTGNTSLPPLRVILFGINASF